MIEIVAETGSTSFDLGRRIASGEHVGEGSWLVADRQTAGRGRQGRAWSDGSGNFMGSTAISLQAGDPPAHTLSLVAGVTARNAVAMVAEGPARLTLKWPNDLLVGDAKLAGILLERADDTVIVGIGVNLAQAPSILDRATTSLAAMGFSVSRDRFAECLAECWCASVRRWRGGEWEVLRAEWIAYAHPVGTPLKVHGPLGEALHGTFAGLAPDGALQLQLLDGTTRTIHAGEVVLDHAR